MKLQFFDCSLREQEAAPVAGTESPAQGTPETTNKYHFDSLEREFDIDIDPSLEGDAVTLYQVPQFGWGFRVQPPVQVSISKHSEGGEGQGEDLYEVTFLLDQINRRQVVLPYKDGETPTIYEGPIENKTEIMTQEQLSDAMVKPYEGMGMGMGMGMGGGMGMGMGMGMGGGMGGGMGAPPGGMAPPPPGGM